MVESLRLSVEYIFFSLFRWRPIQKERFLSDEQHLVGWGVKWGKVADAAVLVNKRVVLSCYGSLKEGHH